MDSCNVNNGITRRLKRWLASAFVIFYCCQVSAETTEIAVLLSGSADFYQKTANQIRLTLDQNTFQPAVVKVFPLDEANPSVLDSGRFKLIVTVGTNATRLTLEQTKKAPVLATFIPHSGYKEIIASTSVDNERLISAIFLDQPMERLVQLGRILLPNAKQMGTALGPVSEHHLEQLLQIGNMEGIEIEHTLLSASDNPVAKLSPVIDESDLFIAIPDQAVLNRSVAKWILYLSFRKKIPVIGFSKAYTDAGALASVYTSPVNVGTQAGELIANWINKNDPAIWQQQYPIYWTISTNQAVARALNLSLPDSISLNKKLRSME